MGKNRLARFLILVGIFLIFLTIILLTAGVFSSENFEEQGLFKNRHFSCRNLDLFHRAVLLVF